jgi:Holliday junction resolvase RusA-like endonuclease
VRATGRAYTPAATESYEATIRLFASRAVDENGPFAAKVPLCCSIVAVFAVPVSWSKRKRLSALARDIFPTGKPDADNILKVLGDACNGVVWHDDAQVVTWSVRKVYGERPFLDVEVWS